MSEPATAWERRADAVLGIAASALLACLMLVTFVDVVARYLFNRPIRGAFEMWPRNRSFNWASVAPFSGYRVRIAIGPPLVIAEDESYADAATRLRGAVERLWHGLSEETRSDSERREKTSSKQNA